MLKERKIYRELSVGAAYIAGIETEKIITKVKRWNL